MQRAESGSPVLPPEPQSPVESPALEIVQLVFHPPSAGLPKFCIQAESESGVTYKSSSATLSFSILWPRAHCFSVWRAIRYFQYNLFLLHRWRVGSAGKESGNPFKIGRSRDSITLFCYQKVNQF